MDGNVRALRPIKTEPPAVKISTVRPTNLVAIVGNALRGRSLWKHERVGLLVVFASLLVIATIVLMLFQNQRDARIAGIRSQGIGIARVMTRIPFDQVLGTDRQKSVMELMDQTVGGRDFAYGSIVDPDGDPLYESSPDGIIIPPAILPGGPARWLGQRELTLAVDGRRIIEFHSPLLDDGNLMGFARIAYFYPEYGLSLEQVPFLAMIALPIFLLVPLFYFLLKREVAPLRSANAQIAQAITEGSFGQAELGVSDELGGFMERFNKFVDLATEQISTLENDRARLLTSGKLLTYRKNRVETVLETLPEAVLILDESGSITYANEKVAVLFATTKEEILNRHPHEWCDNPEVLALLSRLEQKSSTRNFTETMRFKPVDTTERSYATKSYPLFSPKDPSVSIGTLVVFRDETREELARQARTDFVAHLAHELKSPLNVLGLYSESLLSEAGQSEEFRIEAANVIAAEVQRLGALITSLLNMTQIESGSLNPDKSLVKLRELLSGAFEESNNSALELNLTFALDLPREMSPVRVDKDLLRIAITNLLSNAVKYNQPGGTVTLEAEETTDAIQIRVRDTGIGIAADELEQVFEKFYRSSDSDVTAQNGHGLGLALARQIIELHHGTLTVTSEPGTGTEFLVVLWKETMSAKQAI